MSSPTLWNDPQLLQNIKKWLEDYEPEEVLHQPSLAHGVNGKYNEYGGFNISLTLLYLASER